MAVLIRIHFSPALQEFVSVPSEGEDLCSTSIYNKLNQEIIISCQILCENAYIAVVSSLIWISSVFLVGAC